MSDYEEIEDCDDCEACKGTGTISWFDHAEGAWRDKHCTDCDGKGVKFTVQKVETRVRDYNEPISDAGHVVGDGLVQRIKDLEAQIERLRVDAKDTAIALARQAGEIERLREALAWIDNHDPALVAAAEEKFGLALETKP